MTARPTLALPLGLRSVLLLAIAALHGVAFVAGWPVAEQLPAPGLREVEILSLAAAGLEPDPAPPQAVPASLPAPLASQAAPVVPPEPPARDLPPEAADLAPPRLAPLPGSDTPLTQSPEAPPAPAPAPADAAPSVPEPAAVPAEPAAPSREVLVQYGTLVAQAINRLKYYPAAARSEGNSGVVEVTFQLDPAGRVIRSGIVRSSGSAALDAAALQMVAAADLPPPPNGPFNGRIAIDFRIRK